MIRLVKKIIGWLKTMFNKRGSMNFEFPRVRVKLLEDKIEVTKNAQTDGKLNIPPTESKHLTVCENEAVANADEFRASQVIQATGTLKNLEEKIRDSQSQLDQENFHAAKFKNTVNDNLISADGKLSNLSDIFYKEDKQVRNFKHENHLTREPESLTTAKILLGFLIIGVLFVIELILNSNLLAPAMSRGLTGGRAIAASVAGLNVFVSFGVGYIALKNFHHSKITRRIISQISLIVYSIFIFYLNWALGAYRAIHEKTGTSALDRLTKSTSIVDPSTLQAHFPWTVDLTFTSLILIFVGIGFAIASLADGYLYNDRYPGYGSMAKLRDETKKEIDRIRERLSPENNRLFRVEISQTKEKSKKIIQDVLRKDWIPSINTLQNIFDGYKRFIDEVNAALTHAVGEYRRINETYRSKPAPEYFSTDLGKKLNERYHDPNKVFAGYADLYQSKAQIEKQMATYLNKIQNEANEYINTLNEYHEKEVNKRIEEIRKKYYVSVS